MSSSEYRISYNPETKQFDSQYPISLVDKNVSNLEFYQTIEQASSAYNAEHLKLRSKNRKLYYGMGAGLILLLAATGMYIVGHVIRHFLLQMVGVVVLILSLGVMIASLKKMRKNHHQASIDAVQQLRSFMEQQNISKYYVRGVQFLVKIESPSVGHRHHRCGVHPVIAIVFCQNPSALHQMFVQQIPVQIQPTYTNAPIYEQQYEMQEPQSIVYSTNISTNQ
jgi:hypothetical protein